MKYKSEWKQTPRNYNSGQEIQWWWPVASSLQVSPSCTQQEAQCSFEKLRLFLEDWDLFYVFTAE